LERCPQNIDLIDDEGFDYSNSGQNGRILPNLFIQGFSLFCRHELAVFNSLEMEVFR
jgi:hypothetical protein